MKTLLKDTYTDLYFIDGDSVTKEEALKKIADYVERFLRVESRSICELLIKSGKHEVVDGVLIMELLIPALDRPFAFVLCRFLNPIDFGFPDSAAIRCLLLHLNYRQTDTAQLLPMANLVGLVKNDEYRKQLLEAKTNDDIATVFRLYDICKK